MGNSIMLLPETVKKKTGNIFKSDKRTGIIVACGILGIALIVLSGMFGGKEKVDADNPALSIQKLDDEEYASTLESKLEQLVGSIEGAGQTKVMVTLKSGAETIYIMEGSRSDERVRDQTENSSKASQATEETESVAIIDGSGGKEPLIQKQLEPEIGGVAIVCEGGGDVTVRQRVIDTVTTVLGISSARVYVTQLAASKQT